MPVNLNLLSDDTIARGIPPPAYGDIPQWYTGGQKLGRESEQANLFRGGLPRDENGNIDWNKAGLMVMQSAGVGGITPGIALQNFDINRRLLEQLGKGGFEPPPLPPENPPPSIQRSVPAPSSTGPAATSFAATEPTGERLPPGKLGNLGTVTGVTIDGQPTEEPPPSFAQRFAAAQVPQVLSEGPEMVAETTGQTRVAQAQPTTPAPRTSQSAVSSGFEVSERNAQRYESAANKALQAADIAAATKNDALAANLRARAEGYMKQADIIRKTLAGNVELTPEEKNVRREGVETPSQLDRAKTAAGEDAKSFVKQNDAIQAAGNNAASGLGKAQLAKQLTLDPNFTSGPWAPAAQQFQQWRSLFGANPASAQPMESFNKLAQDMLQEQIKSMGQSGVGRVLMSEVNIMRQAIAGLGITPASNRALLEMAARTYQKQIELAKITQHLPPNTQVLNATVQNYLKANPMFTPEELRNPTLIGAPDAPPGSDRWEPGQWRLWGSRVGVKPGEPIRYNGRYIVIQ